VRDSTRSPGHRHHHNRDVEHGMLKYARPEQLGVGRFAKVGIPAAASLANRDGAFEIGCGLLTCSVWSRGWR
jgi:hypothetical protein